MSILITDMEMPEDGCHHIVCIYADGTVATGRREYRAVPVPAHGRLIDADELRELDCWLDDEVGGWFVQQAIDDAPTVIEKEPEEGEG